MFIFLIVLARLGVLYTFFHKDNIFLCYTLLRYSLKFNFFLHTKFPTTGLVENMDNRLRETKFERIYFVAISIFKSKEKIFRFQKIEESLKKPIQRQLRLQLQYPQYAQNQLEDTIHFIYCFKNIIFAW